MSEVLEGSQQASFTIPIGSIESSIPPLIVSTMPMITVVQKKLEAPLAVNSNSKKSIYMWWRTISRHCFFLTERLARLTADDWWLPKYCLWSFNKIYKLTKPTTAPLLTSCSYTSRGPSPEPVWADHNVIASSIPCKLALARLRSNMLVPVRSLRIAVD